MGWFSSITSTVRSAVGHAYNSAANTVSSVVRHATNTANSVRSNVTNIAQTVQHAVVQSAQAIKTNVDQIANSGFVTGLENNIVKNTDIQGLLGSAEAPIIAGIGGFGGGLVTVALIAGGVIALKYL